MKKQFLIVTATVAAMLIGLGSLVAVEGSEIVTAVPGNTVISDSDGDLLLRNCDPANPAIPCSLPPGESPDLPGYLDIKEASIREVGRKWVDLSIELYEPIPPEPSYPFVNYSWQFKGGCIDPTLEDKPAISIEWKDWGAGTWEWGANWVKITSCNPRAIVIGDPVPFKFTRYGVKVRVALSDLLTATDETGKLIWHAAVRLVPFIYSINTVQITRTVAVDFAPDVVELASSSPYIDFPEESATWVPR